MLKKILQFSLFLGLGVGIMALVFRQQNAAFHEQCRLDGVPDDQCRLTDKLLHDFSTVHIGWILAVMVAFTISNMMRAARWQMLTEPMGYRIRFPNALLSIFMGYFANLGFPRMGEVVRAGTLANYEKIPLEKVMGTCVIDRLMDVFCLALVLGMAFLFEGNTLLAFILQQKNGNAAANDTGGLLHNPWVLGLLGLGVLALLVSLFFWKKIAQLAIVQKVTNLLSGFITGFRSVFLLKNPWLFIAYSLGIWVMFYLQCLFNLYAFPPTAHLSAGAALMVFVFGTFGFVVPSPGGMGTYHALAIAALSLYGIAGSDGFSYANISFFAVQIFYNVVAGVMALIVLPIINKSRNGTGMN